MSESGHRVATRRSGPLADSYPAAVVLVVVALAPYLMLTAAVLPLSTVLATSVGLSKESFTIVLSMSDAAYAFGTVLAVQFAQHLRPRRMLVRYAVLLVVASVLAVWAPTGAVFAAGFVGQGLCTSLLLIAAVPPLVIGWPARKVPVTASFMNLCIFGAVALGPTIGALLADAKQWRPLFIAVVVSSTSTVLFALLTFQDDDPADRSAPWDIVAVVLAAVACAAAFFGVGLLEGRLSATVATIGPLAGGVLALVILVIHQYRARQPLTPVRLLATTMPTVGLLTALLASAAGFGLMELLLQYLKSVTSPLHIAALFAPEFGAAVLVAGAFGLVLPTRGIAVFALSGLVLLVASAVVCHVIVAGGAEDLAYAATTLIGLGLAASVSPALFLAGLSLRSVQIQRVFALIELLRGVAAFVTAPLLVFVVSVVGSSPQSGLQVGVWVCLLLAAGGGVVAGTTLIAGGGGLPRPDIEEWQERDNPAWISPPLFDAVRSHPRHARERGHTSAQPQRSGEEPVPAASGTRGP
ncbi:MAG TPA: MFS transporter [Mycobacteriales bacterium]|nr:MFS transporter [Mycobacteriales bacterium]